jgi:hypothetical protein
MGECNSEWKMGLRRVISDNETDASKISNNFTSTTIWLRLVLEGSEPAIKHSSESSTGLSGRMGTTPAL